LREYLIYWGFTPSPIPLKHSNPKVSKLGLRDIINISDDNIVNTQESNVQDELIDKSLMLLNLFIPCKQLSLKREILSVVMVMVFA
jgi:hypothetical protein